MIVDNGKYYLYRHIRLDKNEPFYIGIGTKPLKFYKSTEYIRAFSKIRKSSKIWKNIVSKTEYKVEILLESDDYEFIKQKEIEFIKLYGRKDLKQGILANLTNGGDGTVGYKHNLEKIENHKKFMTGRKQSKESINKRLISRKDYKHSKITKDKISKSHSGKKIDKVHFKKLQEGQIIANCKPIIQYSLNKEFIKKWNSIKEASETMNLKHSNISANLRKITSHCGNFLWEFDQK